MSSNWGKTEAKVCKEVKGGGGSVMVWEMFSAAEPGSSYKATWQDKCKCLSESPLATCSSFPQASPNGDRVMAEKPTTVTELWIKITPAQC